jgi:alanyl-tRNA synthetase
LGFAIADGIQPGNTDRNYVLRRILRRAVRYGRTLGFHEPFFHKLVDVLADTMGGVFPEIRAKKKHVQEVIRTEEEAFNKTLDRGIEIFEEHLKALHADRRQVAEKIPDWGAEVLMSGRFAFVLYDTYGFPLDLTELMARERGLTVDTAGFEKLMDEQRARARAAQKKEVISLSQIETTTPTKFVGFENLAVQAKVLEVVSLKDKTAVILDTSACYAEMGGQVGDTGELTGGGQLWRITNTQKSGNTWLHFIEEESTEAKGSATVPVASVGVPPTESGRVPRTGSITKATLNAPGAAARDAQQSDRDGRAPQSETPALPIQGENVMLIVDRPRREAIQRHHTVTHLLHWALHEVVSKEASQKGSFVGPDKLTFDFNSAPLTPQQVADVEKLVNERILENAGVSWTEVPHADVKSRKDVMQFFGDKYGDTVRVVQIGGGAGELNGYSMELCGGTHTRATGEIGLFRIVGENAIAAGVRRIEAVAGLEAYRKATDEVALIKLLAGKVNSPVHELEKKIESLLEHQKAMEKQIKIAQQREASNAASNLLEEIKTINGVPAIIHNLGSANGDFLQSIADSLKGRFNGVIILGGVANGAVALVAAVSPDFTAKVQAGKIIQQIAPIVGGKGGGKPDNARGGGKDAGKLDEALAKARTLLGS